MRFHLDENQHVLQIVSGPLVKGLQQLQTVALRAHVHLKAAAISRWVLVGVLTWVKVSDREFVSTGGLQLEFLTVGGCKIICLWVEVERTGDCQGSHDLQKRWREFSATQSCDV